MRIVGGKFAGRDLTSPNDFRVRPTAENVRARLLAVLAAELPDARVLDLFAGTGALGLEALSRGAAHATFLDNDATAIKLIGENVAKLGETGAAKVVRADATRPPPGRDPCDLVFLDPPYRSGKAAAALAALASAGWVAPDAVVTVELAHNEDIIPPAGFEAIDERRYGAAKIVILRGKP